jgi:undecaprenyl-diphosphatase
MNQIIFSFFYSLAHRSTAIDATIAFIAQDLVWVMLVAVFFFLFKNNDRRKMIRGLAIFFITMMVAIVAETIFKNIFHTERPFVQSLFTETGYAFPSGHTTLLFSVAVGLWFEHRRAAIFAGIGALLVGLARISAGVHWPIDIAGGIVLGAVVGVGVYRLARRLLPNA